MPNSRDLNKFSLDFVGIGFPRSGTTWVAECLSKHPEIDFCSVKETNYFLSDKVDNLALRGNPFKVDTFDSYVSLFENRGHVQGEFSTNYASDEESLIAIKQGFPDTKIIICLRNPVDALYSLFWYVKNSHRSNELPKDIQTCLSKDEDNEFFKKAVKTFKYHEHLKKIFRNFSRDQIHIILYREIVDNKEAVLKDLYKFLNVDSSYLPPNYTKKVNSPNKPRFKGINFAIFALIRVLIALKVEKIYYNVIKDFPQISNFYNKYFRTYDPKTPLDKKTKKKLYDLFSETVDKTNSMLKKDLSSWKQY